MILTRPDQNRLWRMVLPWLLIATGAFYPLSVSASDGVMRDLLNDQRNYYSKDRLLRLGLAFGVGGIVANSSLDEKIQSHYQDRIRNDDTDEFSKTAKLFGKGDYLIPISLALAGLLAVDEDSLLGEFGNKTARSYLAGGFPMFAMSRITGAGRPEEHDHGSKWRPLKGTNGVSSHAFIGAVPFIVAARMSDNKLLKYFFYAVSLAPSFSRVNDNQHYASQVALGWYMAYEAVGAVHETEKNERIVLAPMFGQDFYGLSISASW